ncbi:unnamed protein product [Withania somnifera]
MSFQCEDEAPPQPLTSTTTVKASILPEKSSYNSPHKPLQRVLSTGVSFLLSLGLLVSPPISIALESSPSNSSLEVIHCSENEGRSSKKNDILSSSIQTRSKAHDIIKHMLASLVDPYTRFLPPEQFSKMARYDMTGIGVNLRDVPDGNGGSKLKVLGLLLDGPGHNAGVRQGDELISVNGVDVLSKSAFEASSLLLGPNGTSLNIMRQSIAKTPVFYRLEQVESGSTSVGYVIYTVGRDPQYTRNIVAEAPPLITAPVIVLVNKSTASGSEIVATADNCRAVLVGDKTYGKGLIQSVFKLPDGSGVVVTIGKYVTPNHMDINGYGVELDFKNFPAWSEVNNCLSKCHKQQEG